MSNLGDLAARVAQLSDTDLVALIVEATAERPTLNAVHAAAQTATPLPVGPPRRDMGTTGAPQAFSVADVNSMSTERRGTKVRQDRIDDIRDSLRKSLKRED